jgi:hypothetical protein
VRCLLIHACPGKHYLAATDWCKGDWWAFSRAGLGLRHLSRLIITSELLGHLLSSPFMALFAPDFGRPAGSSPVCYSVQPWLDLHRLSLLGFLKACPILGLWISPSFLDFYASKIFKWYMRILIILWRIQFSHKIWVLKFLTLIKFSIWISRVLTISPFFENF